MEKYIKELKLKKYLDKKYKDAVLWRDTHLDYKEGYVYYQTQIDLLERIAEDLDLGILGL
jgi:hypothetical protein